MTMSRLEELIAELCPDGVKYKTLGELCFIKARIGWQRLNKREYLTNGDYYLVTGVDINSDNRVDFKSCYYVSKERYEMDTNIQLRNGDIILTKDGTIGKVAIIEGMDKPAVLNSHLFIIRDISQKLNNKFLMYVLLSKSFKRFVEKRKTSGTISGLNQATVVQFLMPVPPLPVQEEIVRILDNFTELTAELTAELAARKKQYEYYRDNLLNFNSDVSSVALGDVATVTKLAGYEFTKYVTYSDEGSIIALRGLNVKNGKLDLHDVKYVDKSDFSKLSRSKLHRGDMLFTYVGTIGQVAVVEEEDKYYLAPNVALIRSNSKDLLPEFMRYYFQSNQFWSTQIARLLQSSSMKNIPMEKIRKFILPIPSIYEQKHIISLLNRFDTLCNDISTGLPAEIEARQKQYEYYQDKLLTFKKLA